MIHSRMPFDWKTPIGYLVTCAIQSLTVFYMSVNGCCTMIFMVGVCFILVLIVEDTAKEVTAHTNFGDEEQKNFAELNRKISKIFQFYCDSKE